MAETICSARDLTAQYNLGRAYADGDGVRKSLIYAEKWLSEGATSGHVKVSSYGVMIRSVKLSFQINKTLDRGALRSILQSVANWDQFRELL